MKLTSPLPTWSVVAPVAAWALLAASLTGVRPALGAWWEVVLAIGLAGGILAAVFRVEVVAHTLGEPYGTRVLAIAVTAIEVALIVSLTMAAGGEAAGLARDTVFAAVMIILNGMVGLHLLSGAGRHKEQTFQHRLQTSLNLALGSALASIGLTIPAVAMVSLATGWTLSLGIDAKSTVLLLLLLTVAALSLGTGRTTVMQGTVHLVIFTVYLFTAIVP